MECIWADETQPQQRQIWTDKTPQQRQKDKLFYDVDAVLWDIDPMGFRQMECPRNEYDIEARAIVSRIWMKPDLSNAELANIVYEVFVKWFGSARKDQCEEIANGIERLIKKYDRKLALDVSAVLFEIDPVGLKSSSASGNRAARNKYEKQADHIAIQAARYPNGLSNDELTDIVRAVFVRSFGPAVAGSKDKYAEITHQLRIRGLML
jgi:hypothetical protein